MLVSVMLIASGCGGDGQGEWSGTARLESEGDDPIDMDLDLEQGGDDPQGSMTLRLDEQLLTFDIVRGDIEDDEVQLTGDGQWQVELEGRMDGSDMSGSLYFPTFEDNGEFEVTRQ